MTLSSWGLSGRVVYTPAVLVFWCLLCIHEHAVFGRGFCMHQDTAELRRLGMHWIYMDLLCKLWILFWSPRELCAIWKQGAVCKLVRKEHVWSNKHFDVVLAKYVKNVELLHSSVDAKIHQDPPPRILQKHGAQRAGISLGAPETLGPIQKFPGATARQCKTSLSSH